MANSPLPRSPYAPGPSVLGFLACSAVVRRDAFLAVGGFSRLLFFGAEESLLAYDLAAAGWEVVYRGDLTAHHHPSTSRLDPRMRAALERRNAVLIAWLRRPIRTAVARTVGSARGGKALWMALPRLPAALRQRRILPRSVENQIRRLEERSGDAVRVGGPAPGVPHRPGDPRFSVVIITRNRRSELLRTLARMTSLPESPAIIVVDNASSDGTGAAVAARYPDVSLLRCDTNRGAIARNLAVREVRTRYVAFCDDDTWWARGALARAADLLDAHPSLASVTGRILVEPELTEDPLTPELRHSPVPGPDWLPGPALLGILAGASMLRTHAFQQVGGFHPRLWLGGEEELLAIDLATRGWWMCWAEDVVVHHAASALRDPRGRRRLGIRNTLWTTWLRRPAWSALRRTGDVLRSLPRDRASVAAVAAAVAGLPWVLRERRVLPPRVEYGLRLLEEPQRNSTARRYVDG